MDHKTKRQHFVPQFYLRYFSDDGHSLWVYDKQRDKLYCTNKKDICVERDIYETRAARSGSNDASFLFPNKIEERLSEKESKFASGLSRLLKNPDTKHISNNERSVLIDFIAHLISRNKFTLNSFIPENPTDLLGTSASQYRILLGAIGMEEELPGLCDQAAKRALIIWNQEGALQSHIITDLQKLNPTILYTATEFVTASFPPLMVIKEDTNRDDFLAYLYLPLSNRHAVLFSNINSAPAIQLGEKETRFFNQQYFNRDHFSEKVIAAHKASLQINYHNVLA